jgi:hypothetical protein
VLLRLVVEPFAVERVKLRLEVVPVLRRELEFFFRSANCHSSSSRFSIRFQILGTGKRAPRHPPMGALGFAPQKTRVPIIPMMCTRTMLSTIDFAVAVPTPTGPPEAV